MNQKMHIVDLVYEKESSRGPAGLRGQRAGGAGLPRGKFGVCFRHDDVHEEQSYLAAFHSEKILQGDSFLEVLFFLLLLVITPYLELEESTRT